MEQYAVVEQGMEGNPPRFVSVNARVIWHDALAAKQAAEIHAESFPYMTYTVVRLSEVK